MRHMNKHSLLHFKARRIFFGAVLFVLWTGCSDDSIRPDAAQQTVGKSNKPETSGLRGGGNGNSESSAGDYTISLTVSGLTWTYVITKNPGAKNLSHLILNLNNCGSRSATINNIVWATVNGVPATLENSEGNTGCAVYTVTSNFIKFDDLPDTSSYTIVFRTNRRFGNFVGSTAWLKAGASCFAYPVLAPCCPL